MAFTIRTTAPSGTEQWWNTSYSPCITGNASEAVAIGATIPNCVGYAWGRFAEILGSYPTGLPAGDAGTWYDNCTAYQKGSTPQVGAVMVFKKANAAGHVAIVEEVYSDGSVKTSESGWSSGWANRFWNDTRTPPLYTTNLSYEFIGFIYNPNAGSTSNTNNSITSNAVPITSAKHPAQIMINEANSHAGSGGHAWVQANTAIGNQAWCAATCCAVVKACGYNGKIAPDNIYTADGFGEAVINTYGGSRIEGPGRGNTNAIPQIGDFIVCEKGGEAYHIGMVRGVEGDKVLTVEGNTDGGQYLMKDRDLHSANIGYYARPDWTKVGGTSNVGNGTQVGGNLYTTKSTQEDASLREVCYLDKDAKPSIQITSIKLSVINYTGILGLLTTIFGGVSGGTSTSSTDNIDGLDPVPREIVSYFRGKGLCTAAGIGIIANIKAESSFDTAAVNAPYGAYGLCQWRLDRAVAMKKMAGSNWSSNLTGQLDYLWYELSTDEYLSLLTTLQNSPNTLEGAKTCTDKFIRDFERSENIDAYSKLRQGYAEEFWKKVVVSSNTASPSGETSAAQGKITTQSGRQITQGNPITIPTDLRQSGIISDYTYYDRDWSSGTTQRTLYDIWVSQGKPSSYGIATIAGYYLVATRPKYGLSGTLITVVLEDNTYFNAIIADTKAGDRSEGFTEWGHTFSTGDSLIEWEALVSQSELNTNLENAGWYGKKVLKIVTYESWLDGSKT